MNITPINSIKSINNINYKNKETNNADKNLKTASVPINEIPAETIKANYIPSFGIYRKVSDVLLQDRETGSIVPAEIKRDRYGSDDFSYKLFVHGKEAGFMDLSCEALFPEDEYVVPEDDNIFPEITHLRTIAGDKYKGIGTALVDEAIKESIRRGKKGSLWLITEQGYGRSFSNYRKDENPIPFYYKMGFRAIDPNADKFIKKRIENSSFYMLPESELLILTSEAVKERNKHLANNFTISGN